jgi:hypothetical protein
MAALYKQGVISMLFIKIVFLTIISLVIGCSAKSGFVIPPNGGASIMIDKPMWISGIKEKDLAYSKHFPEAEENEYLKVVNAGYWLANTNGKISQLVYSFELNNKKIFSSPKVYTLSSFTNPINKNSPIVYYGDLDNIIGSTKITHATVDNVKLNTEYHMVFEVYSDSKRTNLITRLNQKIISPVDNSTGCIKLSTEYKNEKLSSIPSPQGGLIPTNKLIIACKK